MRKTMMLATCVSAVALCYSEAGGASTPLAEWMPPDAVAAELLGMATDAHPVNLVEGSALRLTGVLDRAALADRLAVGSNRAIADQVISVIDAHFLAGLPYPPPEVRVDVPSGETLLVDTVLVVGLAHTGCFAPVSVSLSRDAVGEVRMVAEPDPREQSVQCAIALPTIAVFAADPDDVPAGSTDGADLEAFQQVGASSDLTALELDGVNDSEALLQMIGPPDRVPTLPELPAGSRRFAFLVSGCRATAAELIVTATSVAAQVVETIPVPPCTVATYYLAVFDSAILPTNAELVAPPGPQRSTT